VISPKLLSKELHFSTTTNILGLVLKVMKKYLAVIFCLFTAFLILSVGCSSKTSGHTSTPTQVPLSPLGLTVKQILTDFCDAFNDYDEQACLSYIAPDYLGAFKPGLESEMKAFEAGKILNVKLVPTQFSEPVSMSDGRLDERVTVSTVPTGLSKDQYLMIYMENVDGTWMIDLLTSDPNKTPPSGPTNLVCKIINIHQVDLTWIDNSLFATGYIVGRSTNPQFLKNNKTFTLPANSTTFIDTSTQAGALYYYRVIAFDPAGDSNSSSVVTLQMPDS
jgi:hypothetical protein